MKTVKLINNRVVDLNILYEKTDIIAQIIQNILEKTRDVNSIKILKRYCCGETNVLPDDILEVFANNDMVDEKGDALPIYVMHICDAIITREDEEYSITPNIISPDQD